MLAWRACMHGGARCALSVMHEEWYDILVVFAVALGVSLYYLRPRATQDYLTHRHRNQAPASKKEKQGSDVPSSLLPPGNCRPSTSQSSRSSLEEQRAVAPVSSRNARSHVGPVQKQSAAAAAKRAAAYHAAAIANNVVLTTSPSITEKQAGDLSPPSSLLCLPALPSIQEAGNSFAAMQKRHLEEPAVPPTPMRRTVSHHTHSRCNIGFSFTKRTTSWISQSTPSSLFSEFDSPTQISTVAATSSSNQNSPLLTCSARDIFAASLTARLTRVLHKERFCKSLDNLSREEEFIHRNEEGLLTQSSTERKSKSHDNCLSPKSSRSSISAQALRDTRRNYFVRC